jgi:superfamily II DNA or RNA helicase
VPEEILALTSFIHYFSDEGTPLISNRYSTPMLKDCNWSPDRSYKTYTDNEPIQFYTDCLQNSIEFDLLLGYFSSSAISLLSLGFATFISNGGNTRIVINHLLSTNDKKTIQKAYQGENIQIFDINNLDALQTTLDEYDTQFFECLAFLINENRIQFKIIKPKNGRGIAHYKSGLFNDGINRIGYKASCNFTLFGLTENLEELEAFLDWEDTRSEKLISKQKQIIDNYFDESDPDVEYLTPNNIIEVIRQKFSGKDLNELLINEEELKKRKTYSIEKLNNASAQIFEQKEEYQLNSQPKFPFQQGPREYQIQAYQNWKQNNYNGFFAMATGTGKTVTALNCILQEFNTSKYYKFIIAVPTKDLVNQWKNEVNEKFNFQECYICSSDNAHWFDQLKTIGKRIIIGQTPNYVIITTYNTFKSNNFQIILSDYLKLDHDKITFIADEAHNIGAPGIIPKLPQYITRRLGLSATPDRQFDLIGNQIISKFFNITNKNYTFEYNMRDAINASILSTYKYYPKIVSLDVSEQEQYILITKRLSKYIDNQTGKYKDLQIVKTLLLLRKQIIHKAKNKIYALKSIIEEIGINNFNNAFIYVPEGSEPSENSEDHISQTKETNQNIKLINQYTQTLSDNFNLKIAKFTGQTKNKQQILKQFKNNQFNVLIAMKCLDEGIDIPEAKYAIFCSSTGNPRQYIQRRGRVLRYYPGKEAAIFDLIVKPIFKYTNIDLSTQKIERNLFESEIKRLVNFAVLSENKASCLKALETLCYDLDIDIYQLAENEIENYNHENTK